MEWFFSRTRRFTRAVKKGDAYKVRQMLQTRAGLDLDRALGDAIFMKYHAGVVRVLLEAGANARQPGLLHEAIPYIDLLEPTCLEILEALVQAGADVNQKNSRGESPASLARERGLMRIAAFLERRETPVAAAPSADPARVALASEVAATYALQHVLDTGQTPSRDTVAQWVTRLGALEQSDILRLGGDPKELRRFLAQR